MGLAVELADLSGARHAQVAELVSEDPAVLGIEADLLHRSVGAVDDVADDADAVRDAVGELRAIDGHARRAAGPRRHFEQAVAVVARLRLRLGLGAHEGGVGCSDVIDVEDHRRVP